MPAAVCAVAYKRAINVCPFGYRQVVCSLQSTTAMTLTFILGCWVRSPLCVCSHLVPYHRSSADAVFVVGDLKSFDTVQRHLLDDFGNFGKFGILISQNSPKGPVARGCCGHHRMMGTLGTHPGLTVSRCPGQQLK